MTGRRSGGVLMTRHTYPTILLGVALALGLAGATVAAGEPPLLESETTSVVGATPGTDPLAAATPEWGLDYSNYFITSAEFVPRSSNCSIAYKGLGYIYTTAGSGDDGCLWAPLVMAPGSYLHGLRLFYYDASASDDISLAVTRYYGETTIGFENLAAWTSSGSPGYASDYVSVGQTIRYQTTLYDVDTEQGFAIVVCPLANTSDLAFKGVRITYYLQISPAPATATFNDVPVGAFAFQHIEALAASGITAGCGGGDFCPDAYVTRAQMAVFLAKALGLHWDR